MATRDITIKEVVWYRVDCSDPDCGFIYQSNDRAVSEMVAEGHDSFHRLTENEESAPVDSSGSV